MQFDVFKQRKRNSLIFFALLMVISFVSITITEFEVEKGITSIPKAINWSLSNFYPDADSLKKIPAILSKLKETVLMSIAATTIASILALLFALFGSKTVKINGFVCVVSRSIASAFRNIPVVAWAMVLLLSFGQSSLTGFFALFFVTFGFLTRAFIETIDETSNSSVEALNATGANYFQTVFQAVIPSCTPQMISWILFMIETNIRSSTLVGILTGTGIGFSFDLYYKSMNYNAASLVVIFIILTVFIIELVSNYIRRVVL